MYAERRLLRGQALIECLVGLIALVPLFLLAAWLGKVQALRQSTIEASRLLAFECTVRGTACASAQGHARLADEARRRVFGPVDAPVRSDESMGGDASSGNFNPLWVHAGGQPMIERAGDIGAAVESVPFDAGWGLATSRESSLVNHAADFLSRVAGPGRFGLSFTEGLWVARVQSSALAVPGRLLSLPAVAPQARAAILTDAWTATGPVGAHPDTVDSRVRMGARLPGMMEAAIDVRYTLTRGFLELMDGIGLEPRGGSFRYHQSDVDVVPPDRREVAP